MLKSFNRLHRVKYKEYFRAFFFPKTKLVKGEGFLNYEEFWKKGIHQNQRTVWINGEPAIMTGLEYKRIVLEELNKRIRSLQPKTVIEVGSGNGLNLIPLAILNPHISFKGIEPTDMGMKKSHEYLADLPYEEISYLTGLSKAEIDKIKPNITFEKRSATELLANEADMIITVNVLALIIDEYKESLKKICEATSKYAMFYEGFEEYNNFFQKRRAKRKGTLLLKRSDFIGVGFKVMLFNPPLVNKLNSRDNLLICRK